MTDAVLVSKKLAALRQHVERVRRRRPASAEALRQDEDVQDALAMSLFVAAQEAIDIALHVVGEEGWGVPSSYAEAFEELSRHGVVTEEHARELGRIAAVRNRIAHGYASVDLERLWVEIPAGLDCLDRFAAAVSRMLGGKK